MQSFLRTKRNSLINIKYDTVIERFVEHIDWLLNVSIKSSMCEKLSIKEATYINGLEILEYLIFNLYYS